MQRFTQAFIPGSARAIATAYVCKTHEYSSVFIWSPLLPMRDLYVPTAIHDDIDEILPTQLMRTHLWHAEALTLKTWTFSLFNFQFLMAHVAYFCRNSLKSDEKLPVAFSRMLCQMHWTTIRERISGITIQVCRYRMAYSSTYLTRTYSYSSTGSYTSTCIWSVLSNLCSGSRTMYSYVRQRRRQTRAEQSRGTARTEKRGARKSRERRKGAEVQNVKLAELPA